MDGNQPTDRDEQLLGHLRRGWETARVPPFVRIVECSADVLATWLREYAGRLLFGRDVMVGDYQSYQLPGRWDEPRVGHNGARKLSLPAMYVNTDPDPVRRYVRQAPPLVELTLLPLGPDRCQVTAPASHRAAPGFGVMQEILAAMAETWPGPADESPRETTAEHGNEQGSPHSVAVSDAMARSAERSSDPVPSWTGCCPIGKHRGMSHDDWFELVKVAERAYRNTRQLAAAAKVAGVSTPTVRKWLAALAAMSAYAGFRAT